MSSLSQLYVFVIIKPWCSDWCSEWLMSRLLQPPVGNLVWHFTNRHAGLNISTYWQALPRKA